MERQSLIKVFITALLATSPALSQPVSSGNFGITLLPASPPATQTAVASETLSSTDAPQLSAEQRAEASKIINDTKERVRVLGERLAINARAFDEALLGEKADIERDAQAANEIKQVLNETADTRLQAARKVVHLLTAEQRSFLKSEMLKPESERGILEAFAKVFHIEQLK